MLTIINFFFLQWFYVRLYKITECKSNKTKGFGFITNVKPLSGWNGLYNENHNLRKPFITWGSLKNEHKL